jgi:hypothetical protein
MLGLLARRKNNGLVLDYVIRHENVVKGTIRWCVGNGGFCTYPSWRTVYTFNEAIKMA